MWHIHEAKPFYSRDPERYLMSEEKSHIEKLRESLEEVRSKVERLQDRVEEGVTAKPLTSLAVSFLAGLGVGALVTIVMSRDRD